VIVVVEHPLYVFNMEQVYTMFKVLRSQVFVLIIIWL